VILTEEKGLVKKKYNGMWPAKNEPQYIVDNP
jgi:hypothetical protein